MNRVQQALATAAAVSVLVFSSTGCKSKKEPVESAEEQRPLVADVSMGNPDVAGQLNSGFFDIVAGTWRWTGKNFAVTLAVPLAAAQRGAALNFKLTVPEPVIKHLHTVTLSASVNGVALAPEPYSKSGTYTYTRDIAPAQLKGDRVRIDFALDKAIPPNTDGDSRELGVISQNVSLVAK